MLTVKISELQYGRANYIIISLNFYCALRSSFHTACFINPYPANVEKMVNS